MSEGNRVSWRTISIGEICRPTQWTTIPGSALTDQGFPVYGANGLIGFYTEYNHENPVIAVTCRGATCGEINWVPEKSYVTGNSMCLDDLDESIISQRFLYQNLKYTGVKEIISGSAQPQIIGADIRKVRLNAPPLPEQQKIADILGTWDEALEKLDALIAAQDRRKQALMQQLLTGQRRLPGFDKSKGRTTKNRHGNHPYDWTRLKLGNVTIESSVRADTTTGGVVLSCTKHHGLVPSEEYFGKRVYSADTSAYKVARRGEFAYATNHIEEGSIGYQNICDVGLVSPIYTVFKTTDEVDDAYFYRLLKSTLMIHLYRANTSSSVDRRGSLRYGEFAEIKISLPQKPEQRAIAEILDTADSELRLLRQQRTALDRQKRGLMQQLLTGRIRVAT